MSSYNLNFFSYNTLFMVETSKPLEIVPKKEFDDYMNEISKNYEGEDLSAVYMVNGENIEIYYLGTNRKCLDFQVELIKKIKKEKPELKKDDLPRLYHIKFPKKIKISPRFRILHPK